MRVWVNVWVKDARRRLLAVALAACAVGCIDDFDNPKGYGPSDGTGTTGGNDSYSCSDLCERSAACDGGGSAGDCRTQCVEITNIARRGGCSDELDDLLECFAELSNVCTQQDRCSYDIDRFSACISQACETDPVDCPI